MKRLATAALALAIIPAAYAQQGPGTDSTAPQTPPAAAPSVTQLQSGAGTHFVTKEETGEWLVGNLWKKSVYDASGRSIGELRNVVVGHDGKIAALVIGVGGFLGIGEKDVAVDYNYVEQQGGVSPNRIVIKMTEQELRSAPEFRQ